MATFLSLAPHYVVADPAGRADGEALTEAVVARLRRDLEPLPRLDCETLTRIVEAASESAYAIARAKAGAGCTLAVLHLSGDAGLVAWVGDVRVYRLRDDTLTLLTRDHTLRNDYEDRLSPQDDRQSLEKIPANVIVRGFGMAAKVSPDVRAIAIQPDDTYLLVSSGVWSRVGETLLAMRMRQHRADPAACVGAVLAEARANVACDTLTVLVCHPDRGGHFRGTRVTR